MPPSTNTSLHILVGVGLFIGASLLAVFVLGYGCFVLSGTDGGGILGSWLSRAPGYMEVPSSMEEGSTH